MRIYIAPCGVGLGHVTRCEPIARELAKRGGEVLFSTYGDGIGYAKKMKLKLVKTVPIYLRVRQDGSVDFKSTATRSGLSLGARTFIRQVIAEIRNLKAFKPDLVFSDSRASTLLAAKMLGIPTILMLNQYRVNIVRRPSSIDLSVGDQLFYFIANIFWTFFRTLLQGLWSLSDQILIPDFPSPYTVSVGNLAIPRRHSRKTKLIGPVVTTKPNQIPYTSNEIRRRHGLETSKPLVYVAISGPTIERRYLARKLDQIIRNSSLDSQFVMSRGEPSGSEEATKHRNLLDFDWLDEKVQYQILKTCDLVVSRAGHGIIMKTMSFGKPMILIPIRDHTEQYGNASRSVQLGFAKILDQDAVDPKTFGDTISEILESKEFVRSAHEISVFSKSLYTVNDAVELVLNRIHRKSSVPVSTSLMV